MSYEKQNFKDGQVLTAEMLNNMEAWMTMTQPPTKVVQKDVVIYPETTLTVNEETSSMPMYGYFELIDGETYTINWNGTPYDCVVTSSDGMMLVGDIGSMMGGESTGEPFIIMADKNGMGMDDVYAFAMDMTGLTEVTMSITGDVTTITPLGEEYLPEVPFLDLKSMGVNVSETETVLDFADNEVFRRAKKRGLIRVRFTPNVGSGSPFENSTFSMSSYVWDSIVPISYVEEEGVYSFSVMTETALLLARWHNSKLYLIVKELSFTTA